MADSFKGDKIKNLLSPDGYRQHVYSSKTAWVILFVTLILTISTWFIAASRVLDRSQERFESEVKDAHERIVRRMLDYEQILRGGVAFFNAREGVVSRKEWSSFVDTLEIDLLFPGLQGMGFAIAFEPERTEQIESTVRADGFNDFRVYPEGPRELMTSIIYLEPFDFRNQRAFGYDMFSQKTRRAAMEEALLTGNPCISGKVILLQETESDIQPGFLMYLPVYRDPDSPFLSSKDRKKRIIGFVYSPFRMNDLMFGILGSSSPNVVFNIFDGQNRNDDTFLFTSSSSNQRSETSAKHFTTEIFSVGSHSWTIDYYSSPDFEKGEAFFQPHLLGIFGIFVDFMLFFVILTLQRNRETIAQQASQISTSQQLYKAIIEGCPDGFFIQNNKGEIIESNHSFYDMMGYGFPELAGQSLVNLDAKNNPRQIDEIQSQIVIDGWKNYRTSFRCKNGEELPVDVLSTYWSEQGGRFFTFVKDITETLASENSLIQAKKQAELASEAKSGFLANMSHEIRTPMNAILGLTQLALETEIPNETRDYLNKALQGSSSLLAILNDILDYSKIEANQLNLSIEWVDVRNLFEEVNALFQIQAEQSGLSLKFEVDPELISHFCCDPLRVRQILNNLVGNAIKFSTKGDICTSVRLLDSESPDSVVLEFSVSDQGMGISDEQIKNLFKPFTQADSSITKVFGGTGLGLSICDRLVKMMGGKMRVESELGKGSTFSFTISTQFSRDPNDQQLPEGAERKPSRKISGNVDKDQLQGIRILLGEDNSTNQLVAQKLLERRGASVSIASNGKDVLEQLKEHPFDLVLLDLNMPVMGGLECVQIIRSEEAEDEHLPVLAMTAAVTETDRQDCLQSGMDGFIGKPFRVDDMVTEIVRFTRASS